MSAISEEQIKKNLKEAWAEYKSGKVASENRTTYNIDNVTTISDANNIIIKVNGKLVKYDNGKLSYLSDDVTKCSSLGIDSTLNCNEVIKRCLIDNNINDCIKLLQAEVYSNSNFIDVNLNPELVLVLLHKLGFKAVRNDYRKKSVINVNKWKEYANEKYGIDITSNTYSNTFNFLQQLVDYVNSHPELLNPLVVSNTLTIDKFTDAETKKNKYGRIPSGTSFPLIGLHKATEKTRGKITARTTGELFNEISSYYGVKNPFQTGGAHIDEIMASFDNNDKLITVMYNKINSIPNIQKLSNELQFPQLVAFLIDKQNDIIAYIRFLEKVKKNYDLLKYTPTKIQLTGTDIENLEKELEEKVEEYRTKEKALHNFFEKMINKNFD